MLRFLGGLLVLALLIGAFGYGRGWFTVDPSTENGRSQVTFGLDRQKVEEDLRIAKEKIATKQATIDEKMLKLRERSARATSLARTELDQTIVDLERQRVEVARKIEDMKSATGERLQQLKAEVTSALENIEASIDRALAKYP